MSFKFTNRHGVSLAIAPFLAYDDYAHSDDPTEISATSLIKPVKATILGRRNADLMKEVELIEMAPSSMGSAMHARLEAAWKDQELVQRILADFGHSQEVIDRVVVNPHPEIALVEEAIPVFTEIRFKKKMDGWTVTGQVDLVINGRLHDMKSSSVWGYIYDSNAGDYIAQGSIYRWLSDGIITDDTLDIEYLFTDWSAQTARTDRKYPQKRIMSKEYPLWSITQTDQFIRNRLQIINDFMDAEQTDMPACSKEELWQSDTKYKYFKNPDAKRATKNFTNLAEAHALQDKNGCGKIVTVPGQVKRCNYCNVVDICEQAIDLEAVNLLIR